MISSTVIGNIVSDGELKSFANGSLVKFTVASNNRKRKDKADSTTYVTCTLWGNRAEGLAPYLLKGTQVAVVGSMEEIPWETSDKKGKSLELDATEVVLLGSKKNSSEGAHAEASTPEITLPTIKPITAPVAEALPSVDLSGV